MKQRTTLPVAGLAAGMIVATPVTDAAGHVLLPAGAVISEGILGSLARHEVTAVCVDIEIEEDLAQRAARETAVAARLAGLFRHAGDGLATRALHEAVLAFRRLAP